MERNDIGDQVNRILRSESFSDKDQLKKLLEVLFKNLDSQTTLKPDRVIRELWPEEIKTKQSADVATEMNRLRKALTAYYGSEGQNDPIRITLPNRSAHAPDGTKEKRWIVAEPLESVENCAPIKPASVKPRRWLRVLAAVGVICIVVGMALRMVLADSKPQFGRLDSTNLTVFNSEGKELWHKSFPDGFWREYYDRGLNDRIWFGDLDDTGRTEVLFLYNPAGNPLSHSTTLICFSDTGREKWRWTPGRDLPELNGTPPVYLTFGFGVLKPDQSGNRRIVVSSQNQPYYPDQIALINSTGKTVSEYWHSGILNHLALADLDGNGKQEIIATGISNGYDQATLIVLDPDRVFGASDEAQRPEVQLHRMGKPQERLRLLFPRSDLNRQLSVYNAGEEMTINQAWVELTVSECTLVPNCLIVYEFDKSFNLRGVTAGDPFRSAHKQFYLNRKDDHPFSKQEEDEFQKIRCLVGCKMRFVPVQLR